jgi:hypothetical protein
LIIALDYDDTFTRDPGGWRQTAIFFRQRGHKVYGVTMRYEREGVCMDYESACDKVFFTGRKQKRQFMNDLGIFVSVWIDDCPEAIVSWDQPLVLYDP